MVANVDTTLGGLTVVDPDGIEHDLSGGNPLYVLLGLEGLHMPPVDLIEENVPRQPGGRLREVRFTAREIDLPLRLVAATPAALALAVRGLLGWFNPTRAGASLLRFTAPDGKQREIAVRYVKGLDFNDDLGAWRVDRRTTLVLRAHDPYWTTATSARPVIRSARRRGRSSRCRPCGSAAARSSRGRRSPTTATWRRGRSGRSRGRASTRSFVTSPPARCWR